MILKRVFKKTLFSLLLFLVLLIMYFFLAFLISKITIEKEVNSKEEVTIFIMTNGVHTDIVLPVKNEQINWSKKIKFENTTTKDSTAKYVALGWGDRGFYLETPEWEDLKLSVALKAATGLGSSAIHTTFYSKVSESKMCKKILISKEQYKRLILFIDNSFQKDSFGNYIHIKTNANYNNSDAFYEAKGSYSLFYTCNTWANNGLKTSGQRCCFWTPFDKGIFSKYK